MEKKGLLQINDYTFIKSSALNLANWQQRTELISWAYNVCPPKPPSTSSELGDWIELNIVDDGISMSSRNYFQTEQLNRLGWILNSITSNEKKELIGIREWKMLHFLYLNQFFARVLKGGRNQMMIYKTISSAGVPRFMLISFTDFANTVGVRKRKFCKLKEKEEEQTAHMDWETRKDALPQIRLTLRQAMEKMKAAKQNNNNEAPPPKKKQKKEKRERLELNATTMFQASCKQYDNITSKPTCNMITYDGKIIDPESLTEDGVDFVVDFFRRHNSEYLRTGKKEFNGWIPFVYSFESTFMDTKYLTGLAAWENTDLSRDIRRLDSVMNHIYAVICAKNEYSFLQFMNFAAHVVQRPWENCNIMINIQGPQGICKTEVKKKIYTYLPNWKRQFRFSDNEI